MALAPEMAKGEGVVEFNPRGGVEKFERTEQSKPAQPASQMHPPCAQAPWPEQFRAQSPVAKVIGTSHATPPHPTSQTQVALPPPTTHAPRPLQPRAQEVGASQAAPPHGATQRQEPLVQTPLKLQLLGHSRREQSLPPQPASQTHAPLTHEPLPLQSFVQALTLQSAPPKPGAQTHARTAKSQIPLPLQSFVQPNRSQATPA